MMEARIQPKKKPTKHSASLRQTAAAINLTSPPPMALPRDR